MSETLSAEIIVGIDTHKHIHAAVAITTLGTRLDTLTVPVGGKGYHAIQTLGAILGTDPGRFAWRAPAPMEQHCPAFSASGDIAVVEVNRPNRQLRYQQGKSDPLDAEAAAHARLSGQAEGCPKCSVRGRRR